MPELLVAYACDQNATVRVAGVVRIAAAVHGGNTTKAKTVNLAAVSSRAVLGKPEAGVVLALPRSAAKALSAGVPTAVTVMFKVKNANGIGLGTIKFGLVPLARATSKSR